MKKIDTDKVVEIVGSIILIIYLLVLWLHTMPVSACTLNAGISKQLNEYNQQLNILSNENNHYKNKIEELDKMFLLFNFFIKRISTIFPSMTNHIISFEDSKKFQNELIYFENCIIDLNQQNISLVNKIKQYQNTSHSMPIKISEVSSMEEKIKQIAEENKRLELKLKSKQNIK